MKSKLITLLLLIGSLSLASSAQAATLNVQGGQLVGASGVDVSGTIYNVEFIDDSCVNIFSGCDEVSDLDFQTAASADAAAQALLDQVFLGNFDSDPTLTIGCNLSTQCNAAIPYAAGNGSVFTRRAGNFVNTDIVGNNGGITNNFDLSQSSSSVYAKFTVAPVPVPAAVWFMGSALVGLVGFARRNR